MATDELKNQMDEFLVPSTSMNPTMGLYDVATPQSAREGTPKRLFDPMRARYQEGDIVTVRDKSKKMEIFQDSLRKIQGDNPMPWLGIDKAKLQGSFLSSPQRDEIVEPINEQLVVELYSK